MTESIGEYCVQQLKEFEEKNLSVNCQKTGTSRRWRGEKETLRKARFEKLCSVIKVICEKKFEKEVVSNQLVATPSCLFTRAHASTSNMERIIKAQSLRDYAAIVYMAAKKHLEINTDHSIIETSRQRQRMTSLWRIWLSCVWNCTSSFWLLASVWKTC